MRKITKRVLSVLLCMILVLASAMVVSAKDTATENAEKGTGYAVNRVVSAVQQNENSNAMRLASTGSITLQNLQTGDETATASIVSYGISDPVLSGYNHGYSQQVSLQKGTVIMGVLASSNSLTGNVNYGVFKDAALKQPVDSYGSVTADGDTNSAKGRAFQIPSDGTYYLGLYSYISAYSSAQTYTVSVSALYASGVDRTLTSGQKIVVGQKSGQTNYFKFKAAKTGYIEIKSSETFDKVTLCNSKKKALSGQTYTKYAPTYGVKKGTTYYVKVESNYNTDGGYTLQLTNKGISEKSGAKKAKAVTIKKGKAKKGTIIAGNGQADWYKFRVTSKKKVTVTIKGSTNDRLKVAVYQGSRNMGGGTFWYSDASRSWKSIGKLSKGTYYIKICRANAQSSGWYSISWK